MLKLYWAADSGALAPQILLEESGADYTRIEIDLEAEQESTAEFLAVNPRGQVPAHMAQRQLSLLASGQHQIRTHMRDRQIVVAVDTSYLFDQVCLDIDIKTRSGGGHIPAIFRLLNIHSQSEQHTFNLGRIQFNPQDPG